MRKRNYTVTIRMNKEEYDLLQNKVKESGRTQQEVVIKAIVQNGAFQNDLIDFFRIPLMWYVRFCDWLVYPTYDNGYFTNVFAWKSFGDSSTWRCNQRVSACEFDSAIWVHQYGSRITQSVS